MEEQHKMYVNNLSITIDSKNDTVNEFTNFVLKFDVDLNPEETDKEFDIFGQEIITPSLEISRPTELFLQFITKEKPLEKEWFTLLPIHFNCIVSMLMDYESKEDAGMYMWFGSTPVFKTVNRAYFILKKIDALRLTVSPETTKELAMMIDEPIKVVEYIIQQSGVQLNKLHNNNFRPKIRSNEFFKR